MSSKRTKLHMEGISVGVDCEDIRLLMSNTVNHMILPLHGQGTYTHTKPAGRIKVEGEN